MQSRSDGSRVAGEVQQPLLRDDGVAYLLQLNEARGDAEAHARLQYQNSIGRYELALDRGEDQRLTTVAASGALVAIGGSLYATRPVRESFALLRVPGLSGVRGFASNQEIGRTREGGDLLVTDLLPYYGNRLSISDQDVPLDYEIQATEKVVAPPYRGGAVVSFPIQKQQSVTGIVLVESELGRQVPSFGELTVETDSGPVISPLGKNGEFYLDGVAAGGYPATVEFRGGICRFRLLVPVSGEPFVNLGRLMCSVRPTILAR
jgi:outer membrane usher protein